MRLPSRDHTGLESIAGSEVNRLDTPRGMSIIHKSIFPSRASRLTAARLPSGESATSRKFPRSPIVPNDLPVRSNHVSSLAPTSESLERYASTSDEAVNHP